MADNSKQITCDATLPTEAKDIKKRLAAEIKQKRDERTAKLKDKSEEASAASRNIGAVTVQTLFGASNGVVSKKGLAYLGMFLGDLAIHFLEPYSEQIKEAEYYLKNKQ
jgi:hypothetical protein